LIVESGNSRPLRDESFAPGGVPRKEMEGRSGPYMERALTIEDGIWVGGSTLKSSFKSWRTWEVFWVLKRHEGKDITGSGGEELEKWYRSPGVIFTIVRWWVLSGTRAPVR